jgi:hypothetical protein
VFGSPSSSPSQRHANKSPGRGSSTSGA